MLSLFENTTRDLNLREISYTHCGNISNIVLSSSFSVANNKPKHELISSIKKSLEELQRCHPLLRSSIYKIDAEQWIFQQQKTIKQIPLTIRTFNNNHKTKDDKITEIVDDELNVKFNINNLYDIEATPQPLMRVNLIDFKDNNNHNNSNNNNEYFIIVTTSHTAFDGLITIYFLKYIIQFIDNDSNNSDICNDKKQDISESSLLLRDKDYESWYSFYKLCRYIGNYLLFEWYRSPKRFPYSNEYISTINYKTISKIIHFDRERSSRFLQLCKSNQITVTSAFSSLLAYSASTVLESQYISGGLAVDLRNRNKIAESIDGSFVSTLLLTHYFDNLATTTTTTNTNTTTSPIKQQFSKQLYWQQCKLVSEQIKNSLDSGVHYRMLSLNKMKRDKASSGNFGISYALSSLGVVTSPPIYNQIKMSNLYLTSTIQPTNGQLVELTTLTYDQQIYCCFGYLSSLNIEYVSNFINTFIEYFNQILS